MPKPGDPVLVYCDDCPISKLGSDSCMRKQYYKPKIEFMKDYKIDEVFQFGRIKLRCVEGKDCNGCFMRTLDLKACEEMSKYIGHCSCFHRVDRKGIIFIIEDQNEET